MARSHVNHFSEFPYHITARTVNREAFALPMDLVWKIMCQQLFIAHHFDGLRIHAFVLMPNHFHLIASLTTRSLPNVMNRFMKDASREMNRLSGRVNQNWGGRHYKCEIKSFHYFMNAYKYIYQNPVRANLVRNVEHWKYSTMHSLMGFNSPQFPISEDTILFDQVGFNSENIKWLNTTIEKQNAEFMKKALVKKEFKLQKVSQYQHNPLENQLI